MSLSKTAPPSAQFFPLFTPLARAIGQDINMIFYLLIIAVTALVFAVKAWGLVALSMTALALVPLMFAFFIVITLP